MGVGQESREDETSRAQLCRGCRFYAKWLEGFQRNDTVQFLIFSISWVAVGRMAWRRQVPGVPGTGPGEKMMLAITEVAGGQGTQAEDGGTNKTCRGTRSPGQPEGPQKIRRFGALILNRW